MKKIFVILIVAIVVYWSISYLYHKNDEPADKITSNKIERLENIYENEKIIENNNTIVDMTGSNDKSIDDWRLSLVNQENELPENFEIELASIDKTRKFDKRAITYLTDMLQDIKKAGIYNVWVQSSYRSVEYQQKLFDQKIQEYMNLGTSREDAENLTLQLINKPGTSEHNLGLAVDFNYVDYSFDETEGFKWLQENAANYGFILRYRKDKEDITKVSYEPWHWRYVGEEHAKKINELDMCLEEYIKYYGSQR